jgi:hypothetical protein
MKKLLTIAAAFIAMPFCFSQDIITMKNGDEIKSKILEVGTSEIKYKKFENPEGPSYSMPKTDALFIKYENGTKDVFSEEKKSTSADDLFTQGRMDAGKHYRKYKPAATGTLITGLVSPVVGLVPAIITSSTTPSEANLNAPDPELLKNSNYYDGYTNRAKKIKQGKVWKNFGIAFGVNLAAAIFLLSGGQ